MILFDLDDFAINVVKVTNEFRSTVKIGLLKNLKFFRKSETVKNLKDNAFLNENNQKT